MYESAFQQNFTVFPTLGGWLFSTANVPSLAVGAIAALLALRRRTIGEVAASSAFWIFVLLTAIDLLTASIAETLTASLLATNLATNAIGATVVGLIAFVALGCSRVTDWLAPGHRSSAMLRSILLAAVGLIVVAVAYYTLLLVYQPLPAQFEVVLKPPMNGMVTPLRPVTRPSSEPAGRPVDETIMRRVSTFSWVPTTGAKARFSMQGGSSPTKAAWRPGVRVDYRLEVTAYDGCFARKAARLPPARPVAVLDGSAPATFTIKPGALFVDMMDTVSTSYSPEASEPMMYSLSRPERDGSRKVSTIGGGGIVDLDISGKATLRITAAMIEKAGTTHRSKSQSLVVIQGGQRTAVDFQHTADKADPRAWCRALERGPGGNPIQVGSPIATIVIRALPTSDHALDLDSRDPVLSVTGLDGFVDFVLAKDQVLKGGGLGTASSITFGGGPMSDLHVDGASADVRSFDEFSATGSIDGEYLDDGSIRLSGSADQLTRNGRRLNATRWERSSSEMQVLLLTALTGLLALIVRFGWPFAWRSHDVPVA